MGRVLAGLRAAPELVPGLLAVALFVALGAAEGGYPATTWYPAALFVAGLLAVTLLALGRAGRLGREPGLRLAVALLAAFTAWSFLSILWAEVQADAWEGANRALLYLLVFALFAILPWRARSGALLLGAYCFGIAVVALLTLRGLAGDPEAELALVADRLAAPTGYHNGTAALLLAAFFPALLLASRREVPWWARGPLLAAAVVLLEVAIVPQSRGSLIAFPLVALALVALAPGRTRLPLVALPVALTAFLASGPLLDVFPTARDGGALGAAFDDAYDAVLLSAVAMLAYGWLLGAVEAQLRPSARTRRYASRVVGGLAALAAVVGVVLALAAVGNPASWLDERWTDFKSGYGERTQGESRLGGSLGSNRYDFWRVAMGEWADEPVLGLGMEQFAVDYARERRSPEEPDNPHSLEVKVLSQTGLVGALLFAGFLVAAVASAVRARWRSDNTLAGAVAAAGLTAFAYWLAHGSGDWFWELPGLAAPALAWLALSGSQGAARPTAPERPRPVARAAVLGAVLLAIPLVATLVLPWGAARDVEIAADGWPANPAGAFDRLDRARELNPLSDQPDLVAGTIAIRNRQPERARAAFARALERNDANWYPLLMVGTLEAAAGERDAARGRFAAARELAPDDPLIREALRALERGRPLTVGYVDRALRARVCDRLGRTEATPDC